MNSVLTSRAKGHFQTTSRMATSSSSSAAQGTISHGKGDEPLCKNAEPQQSTELILCIPQPDTHEESMAKKESQFLSKNRGVITDDDDDDFEIPELHDLLKAVDEKKNERKKRGVVTDGHYELTERERHDILMAAQNIRNERLQSQRSPELVLVNANHVENSREIRPGDSQENPIIFNDDDDNNDDDDDGGNNDTASNSAKDDTQLDGKSKESSPKAETLSGSVNSRRDDVFRATREDVREEAEQSLTDFSQITTEITSTESEQKPEDETVKLHAAYQSSALFKANPFKRHDKCATSPVAAPSVSLSQSAAGLDYVRRLSREQRDQYTPFLPKKLGIHVERQQAVLDGSSPGASELQCGASIEPEHDGLSLAEAYAFVDAWDEHESSTEPATPCICDGGPGDCGARQHESIEQYSFRQPSVNIDANRVSGPNKESGERSRTATESSSQSELVIPHQARFRGAPRPSPSPDESCNHSVDAALQRSLSSRKRSHLVEDGTPSKRSRRTIKETWKVREAREMAALLDSLD